MSSSNHDQKLETLRDLLGLVMPDPPSREIVASLTENEREQVADWAATCHLEASDNDVEAGPCPKALRELLPQDHLYKNWRVQE